MVSLIKATTADLRRLEKAAIDKVQSVAVSKVDEINRENVRVRDILPAADLQSGADNGWNGTDQKWSQDFSGASAFSWLEAYTVDPNNKMEEKALSIYALKNRNASPITTQLRFRTGTSNNPTGAKDVLQIEKSYLEENTLLALDEPVLFEPGENGLIEQIVDTADVDNVLYIGKVAEKASEHGLQG